MTGAIFATLLFLSAQPLVARFRASPKRKRRSGLRLSLPLLAMACSACQPVEDATKDTESPAVASEEQPAQPHLYLPAQQLGVLFHQVQMAPLFDDSKTFVDSRPHIAPRDILRRYSQRRAAPGFELDSFIQRHFSPPQALSAEFRHNPRLPMEQHLHKHWDYLSRDADQDRNLASQWSTLIPLPQAYVVPGGRFREIYYWDSYFTMRGLAASGRKDLVKAMLDNFAWLANEVGHIPNGNRSYYLSRSQPPFFAAMVSLYREIAGTQAALEYLPALQGEYAFWMAGAAGLEAGAQHQRAVRMPNGDLLNRYYDQLDTPRPESYREDVLTAQHLPLDQQRQLYRNIRAAAESGWDFSSRWMADGHTLATLETTDIVPVDLNSLLFHLEWLIADLAQAAGKAQTAAEFTGKAEARRRAINQWLWNEDQQVYLDLDLKNSSSSRPPTLAMIYPLYFELASQQQAAAIARRLEKDFLKAGGLVTTLQATGEQWDYPNGWAPLQWLALRGLQHYGQLRLSNVIAQRWVALNRKVYRETGRMMEKYNVVDTDLPAGGGEYPLQDGFGWTNGVILAIQAQENHAGQPQSP